MDQWLDRCRDGRGDFSKRRLLIIPNRGMRDSFERVLLRELSLVSQVGVVTLSEWVLSVTGSYRYRHGWQEVSKAERVQFVVAELASVADGVLGRGQRGLATAEAILYDLDLLRLNGHMRDVFAHLLPAYERYLEERSLYDYPRLVQLLLGDELAFSQVEKVVAADELAIYDCWSVAGEASSVADAGGSLRHLAHLERELVELFRMERVVDRGGANSNPAVTSLQSYGLKNGIRDGLSRIRDNASLADDTYVVYMNSSILADIYEEMSRLAIPATFAEGIPIEGTETYAFFHTLLEYTLNNRPLILFKKLVDSGHVQVDGERIPTYLFRQLMNVAGMSFGGRFPALAQQELAENTYYNEDAERRGIVEKLMVLMSWLEEQIERLLLASLSDAVEIFLTIAGRLFRIRSDKMALEYAAIEGALRDFCRYPSIHSGVENLQDVFRFVDGTMVHAEGEKPGHVHVSSFANVGLLYREHYIWYGMATDDFTVKHLYRSPFVAEKSFQRVNVVTADEEFALQYARLERMLLNSHVNHTLYFNNFNTEQLRAKNPLAIWSHFATDDRTIGYDYKGLEDEVTGDVLAQLAERELAISLYDAEDSFVFSPSSAKELVDCSRRFMYRRLLGLYDDFFTEFDDVNWLPKHILGNLYHELLERYVTELQGVDQAVTDEAASSAALSQLADNAAGASEMDMSAAVSQGLSSSVDGTAMQNLIDDVFTKYGQLYVPFYPDHLEREKERALQFLEKFHQEAVDESDWNMLYAEKSFGKDDPLRVTLQADLALLESDEDVDVEAEPMSVSIRLRGEVDRVDWNKEQDAYRVVDYKTGSRNYVSDLQIVLYELAMERWLSSDNGSAVKFSDDSYFDFILEEEKRQKSVKAENKQKVLANFIEKLVKFSTNWDKPGLNPKTASTCRFCDFQSICMLREEESDARK